MCYTCCSSAIDNKYPDLIECHNKAMGILQVNAHTYSFFEPSHLLNYRNSVWKNFNTIKTKFCPDLVFTHSPDDHQDHDVVYKESMRVFYGSSIACYHIPRSEALLDYNYYEVLNNNDVEAKLEALSAYHMYAFNNTFKPSVELCMYPENVKALLRTNGVYIGCEYAEAFKIIRWIKN